MTMTLVMQEYSSITNCYAANAGGLHLRERGSLFMHDYSEMTGNFAVNAGGAFYGRSAGKSVITVSLLVTMDLASMALPI